MSRNKIHNAGDISEIIYRICCTLNKINEAEAEADVQFVSAYGNHTILIDRYNDLVDSLRDGSRVNERVQRLSEPIIILDMHFVSEEILMETASYPYLSHHRGLYRRFISTLRKFAREIFDGVEGVGDMIIYIGLWLIGHYYTADKDFEEFIDARN